jgi:hypothetical protein
VPERLDDILRNLLEMKGDKVTLEWVPEGVEVTTYRGSLGVGSVVPRPLAGALMEEAASRVRRAERTARLFKARIGDRQVEFLATEYDSFGETAFEIKVRS